MSIKLEAIQVNFDTSAAVSDMDIYKSLRYAVSLARYEWQEELWSDGSKLSEKLVLLPSHRVRRPR